MARILLIEDDDSTRRVMQRILVSQGHSVVAAVNGVDGLDRLRTAPMDLLVTDLLMSYSGLTTIRLLRKTHPTMGIVAVSGSATHLEAARKLGAHRALLKPFTAEQLGAAVTETLPPRRPASSRRSSEAHTAAKQ